MRRSLVVALATLAILVLTASPSAAAPRRVVLLDTLPGDQVYACGAREIAGGTSNGHEKQAASFTVSQASRVTSIVIPLSVVSHLARIEVTIVAAVPWDGIDPANLSGAGSWDNLPDESTVVRGPKRVRVDVLQTPCGPADIVTVRLRTPVRVLPGQVYWVVLQNPAGRTSTFHWINGVAPSTQSAIATFVSDSNGRRWVSYDPDPAVTPWRASAMRVTGRQP